MPASDIINDDPRALANDEVLEESERKWLRDIEPLIAFDDVTLTDVFSVADVRRAEQAYRLLIVAVT